MAQFGLKKMYAEVCCEDLRESFDFLSKRKLQKKAFWCQSFLLPVLIQT